MFDDEWRPNVDAFIIDTTERIAILIKDQNRDDNSATPAVQKPSIQRFCRLVEINPRKQLFYGNENEDLLSWLRNFEEDFAITKAARSFKANLDRIKAKHLIVKLRDPARQ